MTKKIEHDVLLAVMGKEISNIQLILVELKADFKELVRKIDKTYATRSELNDTNKDVDGLKDNFKWIVRLIIGTVVVAVIGLVVSNTR